MSATVGFPEPKNSSQHAYTGLKFGIGHLLNYRIPPGLSDLSIIFFFGGGKLINTIQNKVLGNLVTA